MSTSKRLVMAVVVIVGAVAAAPVAAHAEARPTSYRVEAHGVEVEVPAGWQAKVSGRATLLAPRAYKGRAIAIAAVPAMPAPTAAAIAALVADTPLVLPKVVRAERAGEPIVIAVGHTTREPRLDVELVAIPARTGAVLLMAFTRPDQDPLLRRQNAEIMLSARTAEPRIRVESSPPKRAGAPAAPADFVAAMGKIAPALDRLYRLPRPLPIKFEDCGQPNAFYSGSEHSIRICHELFGMLDQVFTAAGISDPAKVAKLTRETVTWVFFHELGHALVGELDLAITGRGEDAADEVATLLLAAHPAGRKAAVSAARWFDIESKRAKRSVFWDTHSMDGQRVVTITCLLYAADPATYAPLMTALAVPAARLAKCKRDYPLRMKAWRSLLAPHTRKPLLPR